jgi:hypothetical protein
MHPWKRRIAMNQFYYEQRSKEKLKELQAEGMRSQALHRSGAARVGLFEGLRRLIARLVGHRVEPVAKASGSPKREAAYSKGQ